MPKWFITPLQIVVTLFLFVEVSAVVGVGAFPAVSLWLWVEPQLEPGPLKVLLLCMLGAVGYFIYGLTLLLVVPIARWVTFSFGTGRASTRTSRSRATSGPATTR